MIISGVEYTYELDGKAFHCAMDVTMKYIGGKWKTVVLWYLRNGKKRFGELRKLCPQITERMLSITLKQLTEDGLIVRTEYGTKPPLRVDYEMTAFGQGLIPLLNEIARWGRETGSKKGKLKEVTA